MSENYNYINLHGEVCSDLWFDFAGGFDEESGLACVESRKRYGFIGVNSRFIINPIYSHPSAFVNGLCVIRDGNERIIINKNGAIQSRITADASLHYFSHGLLCFKGNGGWGFLDKDGEVIIPPKYREAHPFSSGLSLIRDDHDRYGFILPTGELALSLKGATSASSFVGGFAKVRYDRGDGLIDLRGNMAIEDTFDFLFEPRDGMVKFFKNGIENYGFIDIKERKIVINPIFEDAGDFSGGYAPVKRENLWGIIDKRGEVKVDFGYSKIHDYCSGLFLCKKNDETFFLDNKGSEKIKRSNSLKYIGNIYLERAVVVRKA